LYDLFFVGRSRAGSIHADYYLANPNAYLGKEVTLSVPSLNPRNKRPREDGHLMLRQSISINGGNLMVLAPPATAASLIQLCGTNRSTKVGSKVTMIRCVFSREKAARGVTTCSFRHYPRRRSPLLEAIARSLLATIYIIPSFIRPASLIMF
jgi:hypothetical protein